MYSTTKKLWEIGVKRGWTATDSAGIKWDENFVPWKFKDDQGGGTVAKIKVPFWESQPGYDVERNYDATTNTATIKGVQMTSGNDLYIVVSNTLSNYRHRQGSDFSGR